MEKVNLSWEEIEELIEILAEKINKKNKKYDYLVGIARGGLIPMVLLSDHINNYNVYTIRLKLYEGSKKGTKVELKQGIAENIKGKRILLVDDVADTGTSLEFAKEYLENKGAIISTATLHLKKTSKIIPDYYAKKEDRWITYPWSKKEDG